MVEASKAVMVSVVDMVFKTLLFPWIQVPVPDNTPIPVLLKFTVVLLLRFMVLMTSIPAKVMDEVLIKSWLLVSKLAPPPLKEIPLCVIPALKIRFEEVVSTVEVQEPVAEIVTAPLKIFIPVLLVILVAPLIVVVPEIFSVQVPIVFPLRLVVKLFRFTVPFKDPTIRPEFKLTFCKLKIPAATVVLMFPLFVTVVFPKTFKVKAPEPKLAISMVTSLLTVRFPARVFVFPAEICKL